MKELEILNKETKEVSKDQEKKQIHLGSFKQRNGHTLFQFNTKDGKLTKCVFESVFVDTANGNSLRKKIVYDQDCLYISALNEKNAYKKLNQMLKNI